MSTPTPIETKNILLEKSEPLTSADKALFAYFGEKAKILPPFRILNPQNIHVGDRTSIREGCHINAFNDLSFICDYIEDAYRDAFLAEDYKYNGQIRIDHTCQIGRFAFMSCTNSIIIENHVVLSERVFIGDNNHGYAHPEVPIMQQPNSRGEAVIIAKGSWIGVGAAILAGTKLGRNTVVGANSVVRRGSYPSHAVLASPSAQVISSKDRPHG